MNVATHVAAKPFESVAEARRLVEGFESATLTKSEWDHRAHLTVATWYLLHHDESRAAAKVVSGILHFNRMNGIERTRTSGYHETLTLFWLAMVQNFLSELPREISALSRTNMVIEAFTGRPRLILDYYSPERIWSWEARLAWTEPDLQPLARGSSTGRPTPGSKLTAFAAPDPSGALETNDGPGSSIASSKPTR